MLRGGVAQFSVVAFARGRHVSARVFLQMIRASKLSAAIETLESLVSRVCTNVTLKFIGTTEPLSTV